MLPKFQQFMHERQYLTNVSPATLEWYKQPQMAADGIPITSGIESGGPPDA